MTVSSRVALLCGLVAFGCDKNGPVEPALGEARSEPGSWISFAEAVQAAGVRYPGAPAIEVEVEIDEGRALYEVELLVDETVKEIFLEPSTGEIVRERDERLDDEERASLPALAQALAASEVTLVDAIAMAEAKYDAGTVREVELQMHEGRLVMEVEVQDGDTTIDWIHDPQTGDVVGREDDSVEHTDQRDEID